MGWPIAEAPVLAAPAAPRKIVWAGVLLLMVVSSLLLVLFLWPTGKPTGVTFWLESLLLPFLCWSVFFLLRLLRHDRDHAAVRIWNEEQAKNVRNWNEWGARYLTVLTQKLVLPEELVLEPLIAATDKAPFNPRRALSLAQFKGDLVRRREQLLDALLASIQIELMQLNQPVTLHVQCVENGAAVDRCDIILQRFAKWGCDQILMASHPLALNQIDEWIDEAKPCLHLLVSYQLNDKDKSFYTESAVACLLAPSAMGLPAIAHLYRPMQSNKLDLKKDIAELARSQPLKNASHLWSSQLHPLVQAALIMELKQYQSVDAEFSVISLDNALGIAGPVFDWLSLLSGLQTPDLSFNHLCAIAQPNTDSLTVALLCSVPKHSMQ